MHFIHVSTRSQISFGVHLCTMYIVICFVLFFLSLHLVHLIEMRAGLDGSALHKKSKSMFVRINMFSGVFIGVLHGIFEVCVRSRSELV